MPIQPPQSTTTGSSRQTMTSSPDQDLVDHDSGDFEKRASTAKDETAVVASTAVEAGREVIGEMSDQASAVAANAKDQIATLVNQAKDEMRIQGETRGEQLVSGLRTFSDQLSAVVQGRPEQAGGVGTILSDAQQRVQSYVQSVQDRGPTALVDDATAFARRRPGVFLAAASLIGFAVGRLVRSGAAVGTSSSSPETGGATAPVADEARSGPSSATFVSSDGGRRDLETPPLADARGRTP